MVASTLGKVQKAHGGKHDAANTWDNSVATWCNNST